MMMRKAGETGKYIDYTSKQLADARTHSLSLTHTLEKTATHKLLLVSNLFLKHNEKSFGRPAPKIVASKAIEFSTFWGRRKLVCSRDKSRRIECTVGKMGWETLMVVN